MGFIKDAKANSLSADAAKAVENGRQVFAPKLNTPASQAGLSGGIDDWAVMIDAIEASGWRLSEWSVALDNKGRPEAYPLFRRA